jgi:hypothetical protein
MDNTGKNGNKPETLENLWVYLRESSARFERDMATSSARFERDMAASRAEYDKRNAETNRQLKELKESINGISKSNGLFAEEYFFNAFENGKQTFFGEKFDDMIPNLKTGLNETIRDEYDIVLVNGKSVGIIEVKYKGRLDDIPQIINKAHSFRVNYPKYRNHQVFLALAALIFNQRIEDECKKQGIAIVKQVGDTVVIYDENLKAF